jgi:sensor histidine kinase YesM
VTSHAPRGYDRWLTGWRVWVLAAAFWTALGLLNFGYQYLDVFVRGRTEPFSEKLIEELTGAWGVGLLFPALIWLARRVRASGSRWYVALAVHAGVVVAFSVVHTTWMWYSRRFAYMALGLGRYDYGIMSLRYAMEFPNQLMGYAFWVVIILLFDHYRASRDRELRMAQLETELTRVRLHSLEAQLQPHFLFNALNTVSSVMYDDPAAADAMLARLSDLLRRTLQMTGVHEVPLADELATCDLYLAIMRVRFAERLDVRVRAGPGTHQALVPQLLLQPLVENAIRHGDPGPGLVARIDVIAQRTDGRLAIEVRDNGPGISETPAEVLERGVGLRNTVRRLRHLYGDDHHFQLANGDGGGLIVQIAIPFSTAPRAA